MLTGTTLDDAEQWAEQHRDELTAVDEDFLSASRAEQQRVEMERRAARRRVIVAVTVSAVLAIFAVAAVLFAVDADRQRNNAERATADRERERRTAVARQLAASSLEEGAAARSVSLLLAIEAVRATEQDGFRVPPPSRRSGRHSPIRSAPCSVRSSRTVQAGSGRSPSVPMDPCSPRVAQMGRSPSGPSQAG